MRQIIKICVYTAFILSWIYKPPTPWSKDNQELSEVMPEECKIQKNLYPIHFQSQNPKPRLRSHASVCHSGDIRWANITVYNDANITMVDWSVQFDENSFGLVPAISVTTGLTLTPNASVNIAFPISTRGRALTPMNPPNLLRIIISNNVGEFSFTTEIPVDVLLTGHGKLIEHADRFDKWDWIDGEYDEITLPLNLTTSIVQKKLEAKKIFTVARHSISTGGHTYQLLYMSARFVNNVWALLKVCVTPGTWTSPPEVKVTSKTDATEIVPCGFVLQYIVKVLSY